MNELHTTADAVTYAIEGKRVFVYDQDVYDETESMGKSLISNKFYMSAKQAEAAFAKLVGEEKDVLMRDLSLQERLYQQSIKNA